MALLLLVVAVVQMVCRRRRGLRSPAFPALSGDGGALVVDLLLLSFTSSSPWDRNDEDHEDHHDGNDVDIFKLIH